MFRINVAGTPKANVRPQISMQRKPKKLLSSLLAPIAALLIPAILAITTILTDSSSQNDDAPVRAAGLLLIVVLPIMYPFLAIFMAVVGNILIKFHKLSLRNLLIVYGLVCIPISFLLGWPSPFGVKDQIIGITIFFSVMALCMCLGAICWWFLAVGYKKRVNEDSR